MPLIVTPGYLQRQSEFYRQLSTLTHAGIGVVAALGHVTQNPPNRELGRIASGLVEKLSLGLGLAESFRAKNSNLPLFDIALIDAAERSGRLDECFLLLADFYQSRASMAKQMLSNLMYPAFLLHFAIFILPLPQLVLNGNITAYLLCTVGPLIPLYALVFALLYATQSRHGERWRSLLEQFTRPVPLLGKAQHNLALARLAAALEALISAGVGAYQAWELAAAACGSPRLRREIVSWKYQFENGVTPAETVRSSKLFPSLFSGLYSSGETSGQLDKELKHLRTIHMEDAKRQMQDFCSAVPKIIYLAVALYIAWQVLSFYTGYFNNISSVIDG